MGVILCEFESRPPHPDTTEEKSKGFSSVSFIQPAVNLSIISKNVFRDQCKIPVVLDFLHHRHKACIASGRQMVRWTFAASGSPLA